MRIIYRAITLLFLSAYLACSTSNSSTDHSEKPYRQYLKEWRIASTTELTASGTDLTSSGFDDNSWTSANVPTTVLRALIEAGKYPDPHFDLNNFKIPDASDELNKKLDLGKFSHLPNTSNPFKDPYWFRTSFKVDKAHSKDKIWLNFDGINYRADVWLNGQKISSAENMVGMFQRFQFDISSAVKVNEENYLAVKIHQVDHPGTADPGYQFEVFGPQRGWGVDIFKDATLKFTAGWDCAPVVRDRNMGIYQDVYLSFTNNVDIVDPYVVSKLPLPDTTKAALSVYADVKNNSDKPVKGKMVGTIDLLNEVDFITYQKKYEGTMPQIKFSKDVEIPANATLELQFNPEDFPQLQIENPHLWWPNGSGQQYLHSLKLHFEEDGKTSDAEEIQFGIREINSTLKEIDGEYGRIFWVNGQKIFSRGGWLQPDMLLDMNVKRMYDEARLLAEANVNMIANEDMPSPPNHIMEAYDKYGLLMWETFFQCWTSYPGTESFENPTDTDLAIKGALDIIKRYRRHPSLVLWATACETVVREEIYTPVRNYVKEMDPSRPFIATSSYDWDIDELTPYMKPDLPIGMTDDGAPDYTWYPHNYYYKMIRSVKQQMFRNELGVPSVPTMSSMKKFIYDLNDAPKNDIYPLTKNWAHHGAWDDDGYVYRAYDEAIRRQFGVPKTVEDYVKAAQYVNAGSYRAMFEAANHRMWDITSGVMLWKLNSTWPTVVWQIYDWFLNPNSAYYYTKKALEPIHIQLNEIDHTVSVINTTFKPLEEYTASIVIYNKDMEKVWNTEKPVAAEANTYNEILSIPDVPNLPSLYFVELQLEDKNGHSVSENFYWQSTKKTKDYRTLMSIEPAKLELTYDVKTVGQEYVINVSVENSGTTPALLQRLALVRQSDKEEVNPTFWSDNFLTILPGRKKSVQAHVAIEDLNGDSPVVLLDKVHR